MSDSGDEPLIEGLNTPPPSSKKRKNADSTAQEKNSSKKRKLKKPKDVDDGALDVDIGVNHAIGHMDPSLMADHIAQRTKRFRPELSLVELEEVHIPEKSILDTTEWDKPRTKENLPDFLEHFAGAKRKKLGKEKRMGGKLSDAPQEKGSPHTLVVASSGLRAAELVREMRVFQTKEAFVAKLFAKHIKMKEAVVMCRKSRINLGVGTPQRIFDLLENGALSSAKLERIVVDASFIDQKKRGILDMKEVQVPLVSLLARKDVKEAVEGKVELLFF